MKNLKVKYFVIISISELLEHNITLCSFNNTTMSKEEIISVQIGKFSNQIGANVWNLRDEFLYDESESEEKFSPHTHYHKSSGGYVPRCVALDLREHCGNRFQSPYDDNSDVVDSSTWVGKIARPTKEGPIKTGQHHSPYGWCEMLKVLMLDLMR